MSKRFFVPAAAVLLLAASPALASLTIDFEFADGSHAKALTNLDSGTNFTVYEYATVVGQYSYDNQGFAGNGEAVYRAYSSQTGTGVHGDILASSSSLVSNMQKPLYYQLGSIADQNGDGILDIGGKGSLANLSDILAAAINPDEGTGLSHKFLLGSFQVHINSLDANPTGVNSLSWNVTGPSDDSNTRAIWFEDSIVRIPLTRPYLYGQGVTFTQSVPEPGALALVALVAPLLLRRKNRGSLCK